MARSKTSKRWLKEHFQDVYVQKAQQEGYRSRAVYKLQEIQEKDSLISPGMVVVELGAAPGSWSQYVVQCLQGRGRMIALDILPMDPLPDVCFIRGDFQEQDVLECLYTKLGDANVNLVISDMAPNTSGVRSVDQAKSMYLAELTVDFARKRLILGGDLLTKVFHGPGFDTLVKALRHDFSNVVTRKPKASRARSQETYLLARGFKGFN